MSEQVRIEEFRVNGDALVATVKQLVHEGNVHRITIKNEEGQTLIEIPLTIGVVGAVLLPVWAAIGAIAALAARLNFVVEKVEEELLPDRHSSSRQAPSSSPTQAPRSDELPSHPSSTDNTVR